MRYHRPSLLLAFAGVACTSRPLDGTTETGAASTTSATTAESVTGPGATEPDGTSAVPTGPGTPDPIGTSTTATGSSTTDPGGTSAVTTGTTDALTGGSTTVDPSTTASDTSSTSDTGMVPPDPPPGVPGLVGCNQVAPAGTQVSGQSALGPFASTRAYFGTIHAGFPGSPVLLFLSPEADAAAELAMPEGISGAILYGNVWSDSLDKGWTASWPYKGVVDEGDEVAGFPDLVATIEALAGNWDAADPNDPPRLVGTLSGPMSGPFNAIYCNKLDIFVIPE